MPRRVRRLPCFGHTSAPSSLANHPLIEYRQLTAALAKLSGQFETEQRRHSGQVEALQQRFEQQAEENETLRRLVEHFGGQVMRLTADYRTLAETLRGPWS